MNQPAEPIEPHRLTDRQVFATFAQAGVAMVLTDPNLPDNPIVYVNDAFERMTGYSRSAAVGRNCRFLQGEGTDPDHVRLLREAVAASRELTVDILNRRADGTPFRNRLLISPVTDAQGRVQFHLGIQKELGPDEARRAQGASREEALREVHHRVKNHLAMIVGLIRIQARGETRGEASRDPYDMLARRVEAIQLLYEELNRTGLAGEAGTIPLGAYLSRVGNAVAHLDGRPGVRVVIDMAPLHAPVETAARLGLLLTEIVTNAFAHAFTGRDEGEVRARLVPMDGGARLEVADDGIGMGEARWPDMGSMGGRIVAGLVEGLGAALAVESGPTGTRVGIDIPAASLGG